ncbi:hypothetical protein DUU06_24175 [Salmonella enterica subsp. enterica serovar Enteritidis]|uniref:Uncharacterized protein n=1 Tax=Salmonella enteritidis TaxID=149539 RepID=A0A5V0BE13_SALEN|nr:hypothetical protein [Salmonella enterica subsp. enterica serovar Enteritidis]
MLPGRCAPVHLKKIRNWLFSDLTGKREKVYVCSVLYVLYVLFVFHVLSVSNCINCIVPYLLYCVFFIHKIHCRNNAPTEISHEQTAFP